MQEMSLVVAQDRLQTRVRRLQGAAMGLLVLLIAAGVGLFATGTDLCGLAAVSLPALSLVMFVSSATVFLPAPGIAAVAFAGTLWSPIVVGGSAAVGSAAGEMTGYLVGHGGRKLLGTPRGRWWALGETIMRRWGFLFVFVLAAIPNPAFDLVGILAGSLGYPARRLLLAILLGNCVKYTLAASLGYLFISHGGC
jgi:membrane protein YqaA with SNARE-associated domain